MVSIGDTKEKHKIRWEERETIIEQYSRIEIVIPRCLTSLLSSGFFQLMCIAFLIYNLK